MADSYLFDIMNARGLILIKPDNSSSFLFSNITHQIHMSTICRTGVCSSKKTESRFIGITEKTTNKSEMGNNSEKIKHYIYILSKHAMLKIMKAPLINQYKAFIYIIASDHFTAK